MNKNNSSQASSLKVHGKITLGSTNMTKGKTPDGNYISLKIARASIDALIDTDASQSLMSKSVTKILQS